MAQEAGKKRERKHKVKKGLSWFGMGIFYFILYVPIVIMIIYSFNEQKQNMIWTGFTTQWYFQLFQDQELLKIVANTLIVSVVSTILSTIIGTMAAYGITRYKFKGKSILMNILYIPIVIPEIVMGVSLLMIFMLMNFSLGLVSMILAHVTFSAPFVVITVRGRIGDMGVIEEEASMDLGANRRTTFFKVTLPMMMPAIISGAFMAFTLSFDDLVVSTFVAGANSTTLPIKVQSMMKTGVTPEINALSTVIFVILLTLCLLGKLAGWLMKKRSDKLEAEALAALAVPGDVE